MKIIKSAIVYSAKLPGIEQLHEHLAAMPFAPITAEQYVRTGFVPHPSTGELVTPIEGGYVVTLRIDSKLMPDGAVHRAMRDAEAAEAERLGRELEIEEAEALAENVRMDLLAKALVTTSSVTAFYRTAEEYLVVPASQNDANTMVSALVKAIGQIKTTTIHVSDLKHGLSTRLRNHIDGLETAFGEFRLGDSVTLKKSKDRVSISLGNLDTAKQGIREALDADLQVEQIELEQDGIAFKLTKDFRFKGIIYPETLSPEESAERNDGLDAPAIWRMEAATQLLLLTAAVNALVKMLDPDQWDAGNDDEPEGYEVVA